MFEGDYTINGTHATYIKYLVNDVKAFDSTGASQATVPIGYADGMKRIFSNKAEVLVRGKRVPIIGSVCMDSFMIDVTDLDDAQVGDEVFIWDNENITVEELAKMADTINYEIISCISNRVPRVFILRGESIE